MLNDSTNSKYSFDHYSSLDHRVLGTIIYGSLSLVGIFGNLLVITVVLKVRGMCTPTNCYLMSLAASDCLFFLATAPVELSRLHLPSGVYIFSAFGCATLTALPYLAINASSLSITAFTIERYIGICHPMRAKYMCTVKRARIIIVCLWTISILYNSSWLYLAHLKSIKIYVDLPDAQTCTYKIGRNSSSYKFIYMADFVLLYFVPLILYLVLYGRIAYVLVFGGPDHDLLLNATIPKPRPNVCKLHVNPLADTNTPQASCSHAQQETVEESIALLTVTSTEDNYVRRTLTSNGSERLLKVPRLQGRDSFMAGSKTHTNRTQVIKMLVVIVCVFAVCWLPYRAVVLYNSFAKNTWVNKWYIFCSKTLIFTNCAINPILYNLMSSKFRSAFMQIRQHSCRRLNLRSRPSRNAVRAKVPLSYYPRSARSRRSLSGVQDPLEGTRLSELRRTRQVKKFISYPVGADKLLRAVTPDTPAK